MPCGLPLHKRAGRRGHVLERGTLLHDPPRQVLADRDLVLRVAGFPVQVDELEGVLELDVLELAERDLGEEHVAGVDCAGESGARRALRGHERMFAGFLVPEVCRDRATRLRVFPDVPSRVRLIMTRMSLMDRGWQDSRRIVPLISLLALAFFLIAGAGGALARGEATAPSVSCPFGAAELSAIVGKNLARVDLSGGTNPSGQCAFSALTKGDAISPQIYLILSPGGIGDLRESYRYYLKARSRLATHPAVKARPDLGSGAFTLVAQDDSVTTVHFLSGDQIATYVVDLTNAPHADKAAATKLIALALDRLT